ncbi:hypothetical protein V7S43_011259 [Phytophthora oleae]|uniref:Uncharacterized protein n=1 Tax=Phytophthora oleae TaxID=2107226 RepID=A0ABD3FBM8_9STRA
MVELAVVGAKKVRFDVGEGYAVFKEKCLAKFAEVSATPEAVRRPIELPEDVDIYLKKARNDSQEKYVKLGHHNFVATLQHLWKLLSPGDLAQLGDFRFETFLYVQRAAPPEQFHRATAHRVENARMQRAAYEATNAVTFGPITAHHLDVVHARRPDSTPFEVPTDNTTAQAMALDQQREDIRRADEAAEGQRQTGMVTIKMNGLWIPVEVDIISLRRAIGLPDHDIFTQGIFHQFNPAPATNPGMQNVDHLDDEDIDDL